MENISNVFYRIFNVFQTPVIGNILLYHRIANVTDDPHQLSVSTIHFEQHIRWLTKNTHVISLSTLIKNLNKNIIQPRSICLTFDDGYADNYLNALPILRTYNAPATIFITAGKVNDTQPFYWDTKTKIHDQGRPLTKKELKQLHSNFLIEIGSHSMSHPHLSTISIKKQTEEIKKSKKILTAMTGKGVTGFSYPFGTTKDYDKNTVNIVQASGYTYACANFPGNVTSTSRPFMLPRNIIRNWQEDIFIQKMERLL